MTFADGIYLRTTAEGFSTVIFVQADQAGRAINPQGQVAHSSMVTEALTRDRLRWVAPLPGPTEPQEPGSLVRAASAPGGTRTLWTRVPNREDAPWCNGLKWRSWEDLSSPTLVEED